MPCIFSRCRDNGAVRQNAFVIGLLGIVGFFGILPAHASAAVLTWRYGHELFPIESWQTKDWRGEEEVWTYYGEEILPPAQLQVDGDEIPDLPEGFVRSVRPAWDRTAIERTLREMVLPVINRSAGAVTIRKTATGVVVFDGIGITGRRLRVDDTIDLTIAAMDRDIPDIELPVEVEQPQIRVESQELKDMGIREVVSVGESDYRGSPVNRVHNIGVGLRRFNGHLIPQGEIFSFNDVLGDVGPSTGYRKELTIIGDKTLPDYGGGLCQVSTTAYRGVWEYGFPIPERRNHSYSVRYYSPSGTDATIYPPSTDMKFTNDSPGALLIQTHTDGGRAYFIYYGTRDDRETLLAGPYVWGSEPAPPPRTEYTTDLAPGEKKKVGEAVPGSKAAWFRVITTGNGETEEAFYSNYEARPLFYQIGVAPGQESAVPEAAPPADAGASVSSAMSRSAASPKPRFPVVTSRPRRR